MSSFVLGCKLSYKSFEEFIKHSNPELIFRTHSRSDYYIVENVHRNIYYFDPIDVPISKNIILSSNRNYNEWLDDDDNLIMPIESIEKLNSVLRDIHVIKFENNFKTHMKDIVNNGHHSQHIEYDFDVNYTINTNLGEFKLIFYNVTLAGQQCPIEKKGWQMWSDDKTTMSNLMNVLA